MNMFNLCVYLASTDEKKSHRATSLCQTPETVIPLGSIQIIFLVQVAMQACIQKITSLKH